MNASAKNNLHLPHEIKPMIREYASDRIGIHPVAQLVKALEFSYAPEQTMPVYKPIRKTVCFPDGHLQEFYLTDFFPSSWSCMRDSPFQRWAMDPSYQKAWLDSVFTQ